MRAVALLPLIVSLVAAGEAWEYEDNVAVLDANNFDAFIASQEYTIVEFYAPWCGHCKSLAPEWAAAASKTRKLDPPVVLAKADADQHRSLAEKYDVSGFPTIKIFKGGRMVDYDGPRERKGIVSFVKKELGITGAASLTKLASADALAEHIADNGGWALVGLFREPTKASAMFTVFSEVASELSTSAKKKLKAAYSASYANDPVAASLGIKTLPAILLFRPGSEKPLSYTIPRRREDFTEDALDEWISAYTMLLGGVPGLAH